MKKSKLYTVNDFIIFLKNKIAIILFSTFLLSLIAVFIQVGHKDNWEVDVSRTIDKNSLLETIMLIKKEAEIRSRIDNDIKEMLDPIILMGELNDFVNSSMINYLSNDDIAYSGLGNFTGNQDLLRKEKYKLIIPNKDSKITKKIINDDIEKFFEDTTKLTRKIIRMKYELAPNYNLEIYNFKIIRMLRVEGYDYTQILKIILINFVVSIFFIFMFHIRKVITLF
jgi:hypothetical protein|tara:strand:+ start:3397 stop:4071 length:675 start_codon:yes stop_codon:yes gene_type:complete